MTCTLPFLFQITFFSSPIIRIARALGEDKKDGVEKADDGRGEGRRFGGTPFAVVSFSYLLFPKKKQQQP